MAKKSQSVLAPIDATEWDSSIQGGRTARLIDGVSGEPLGKPLHHPGVIYVAAFSPDGKFLLTGSGASVLRFAYDDETGDWGETRLWDARTSQLVGQPIRYVSPIKALVFSQDRPLFAVRTWGDELKLWNFPLCRPVGMPLRDPANVAIEFGAAPLMVFGQDRMGSAAQLRYPQMWTPNSRWKLPAPVSSRASFGEPLRERCF